ncbi:MAG TPA: TonB-dependent receptor [Ignavibacteriaceae bacterium]|nr:MAG: Vitamin B12 transporter BtuB precursor [Ignavibacteria bacterium ADurb.Bin266]OQY73416.1 MAG: hypothetical protein B6D44_07150 [Ignavibacteriales bacterium UTCHB2]HQF41541.1 TonB-dependent receptor [Ignavibacteriaceae bacterium]HQI40255.1 TonB-dependent receptor [Ignavibacteriaceae bacterium]
MYKTNSFLILFLFMFSLQSIFPQESEIQKTDSTGFYRLNDVVVTATKTPTHYFEIANSISVIDSKQIQNSNSDNIFDLLKNEVGITYTQQGGNGTLSNINIRGANSSYTLVLIDGMEMNLTSDPGGVFDFSGLPVDNIDRIEILRGPQSTLYGSDAMAGVVNIITKTGSGSPKFSLLTEGGSYNTYKAQFGLNGEIQKLNYSLSVSRTGSDGFSVADKDSGNTEKDGYTFNNLSALLGYKLSENSRINFYSRFIKSDMDNDRFGGRFGDDPTYITKQEGLSVRIEGKVKSFDGLWDQKIGLSFVRNVRKNSFDTSAASINYPFYYNDYSTALYDGRKYKLDWQNDFYLGKTNILTAGFDYETDQSSSDYYALNYSEKPFAPEIISILPKEEASIYGIYIQHQFNWNNAFFISAGLRTDHHNKFGSQFTYRISPAFMLWETGTKIKTSIGTGFKAPSLFYLYDPAFGNENLKPEKSFGWDLGIEQFLFSSKTSAGATFFYNSFSEMFGFDFITFKTININKAITKGIELFLSSEPTNWFRLKLNYTMLDARDLSPNSSNYDTNLLRRAKHKVGVLANFDITEKVNLNSELIWLTRRDDIDFNTYERVELKGYALLNVAAHYDIFNFLRLNVRVENLLDTKYQEVLGYGTAGLSVYGGIRLLID